MLYGLLKHEIHHVILPFIESLDRSIILDNTYYKHKNLDKYAIVWTTNEQSKLNNYVQGLIKDCKLNKQAKMTTIPIHMLELEYDKVNNTYENSANIVKIESETTANQLMQLLKLQLNQDINSIIVHRHSYKSTFFIHITFKNKSLKDSFISKWIKHKIPLRKQFAYNIYSHSKNLNKEIYNQHCNESIRRTCIKTIKLR